GAGRQPPWRGELCPNCPRLCEGFGHWPNPWPNPRRPHKGHGHDHPRHHDHPGHCQTRVKVPLNNKEVLLHLGELHGATLKRLPGIRLTDDEEARQLAATFPGTERAEEAGVIYFRIPDVTLPDGCSPSPMTLFLCASPLGGSEPSRPRGCASTASAVAR